MVIHDILRHVGSACIILFHLQLLSASLYLTSIVVIDIEDSIQLFDRDGGYPVSETR